jgi:hypothetical protein
MPRKKVSLKDMQPMPGQKAEPTLKEALSELKEEFEGRRDQTFFGFEVVEELDEYLRRIEK